MTTEINVLKQQKVKQVVLNLAFSDPGLEAIFANCKEDEYLEQIIMLCISRNLESKYNDSEVGELKEELLKRIKETDEVIRTAVTRKTNELLRFVMHNMY